MTIELSKTAEGQYGWSQRRSGKLIERSDRLFASEAKAHEIDVEGGFISHR